METLIELKFLNSTSFELSFSVFFLLNKNNLLKLGRRFSVEQFEPTVSQRTVSFPPPICGMTMACSTPMRVSIGHALPPRRRAGAQARRRADAQASRRAGRQTGTQANMQTGKQANRQTGRHARMDMHSWRRRELARRRERCGARRSVPMETGEGQESTPRRPREADDPTHSIV